MELSILFLAFFISLFVVITITPFVIRVAKRYKLVDDPQKRFHPARTHIGSIPRAGGIAIACGLIIGMILFLPRTYLTLSFIVSTLVLTVVGVLDDRKDIHPSIRLVTNAFAVGLVLLAGISIPYITSLTSPGVIAFNTWQVHIGDITIAPLAIALAFVWIYWTMNIVGWSAGVDGQLPGVVVISALILGILSLRYSLNDPSQIHVTILAAIVAGSFMGFLPWNFFPQKIMPGYSGKTLAGFFLGVLGILSYGKLGTALLVLGLPMIDAIFTLSRRLIKGKSPIWADRGHLHHNLLDLGWSKRTIALFYYLLSAILGAVALMVTSTQKIFILLVVSVLIGAFLLWINWFLRSSKPRDHANG